MTATNSLFTPEAFCAAFISALCGKGVFNIRPRSDSARNGFAAVLKLLDQTIKEETDRGRLYNLLKIRTSLAPTSTGSFDNFESYLRGLQTSMVSSPNPVFADLRFNVSPTYATASLRELDSKWASLAESAAAQFKKPGGSHSQSNERQSRIFST